MSGAAITRSLVLGAVACAATLLLLGPSPSEAGAVRLAKVSVTPKRGGKWTDFSVSLRAPISSSLRNAITFELSGPRRSFRCNKGRGLVRSETSEDRVRRGERIDFDWLAAAWTGWCPGRYVGRVFFTLPRLDPQRCRKRPRPRGCYRDITVGRFGFAVRPRKPPATVRVPDITGGLTVQAECLLASKGLRWRHAGNRKVESDTHCRDARNLHSLLPSQDPFVVTAQRPSAGRRVKRNTVVLIASTCKYEPGSRGAPNCKAFKPGGGWRVAP